MLSYCLSSPDECSVRFKRVVQGVARALSAWALFLAFLLWLVYGSPFPFSKFETLLWILTYTPLDYYVPVKNFSRLYSFCFCCFPDNSCFLMFSVPVPDTSPPILGPTSQSPWLCFAGLISAGKPLGDFTPPSTNCYRTKRLETPLRGTGLPEVPPCASKLSYIYL